ncbi:GNAT family N-acetyltransferase, partial [Candidatus Woesearchaeota archaeon]|nr:GNAT family N-acetyltransferase [Candidatus Woesearchaeota archaeon]
TLKTFKTKNGFQIGVRVVVPPFPYTDQETFNVKSKGSTIRLAGGTEGVHIEDVKIIGNKWVVAGTSGVVLTVCGSGDTMEEARRQAYSRIRGVSIPRMYYRNDVGARWHDEAPLLERWGYLAQAPSLTFEEVTSETFDEHTSQLESTEQLYPLAIRTATEEYRDIIATPRSIALFAYLEGKYVGNAIGSMPSSKDLQDIKIAFPAKPANTIYLYNISILPEFQGRGHGLALMRAFLERCEEKGYTHLIGTFRKNGSYAIIKKFNPVDERTFKNWEGTGEEFVRCTIKLS